MIPFSFFINKFCDELAYYTGTVAIVNLCIVSILVHVLLKHVLARHLLELEQYREN